MKRQKPRWDSLATIAVVFGAALLEIAHLPFSAAAEGWLLLLWVVLFYGAVALWTTANQAALERAPQPRDCVGRPIMDVTLIPTTEPEPEATNRPALGPLTQPLSQSEAM